MGPEPRATGPDAIASATGLQSGLGERPTGCGTDRQHLDPALVCRYL